MAVDGVGKVLLVSGDDSSMTSIISASAAHLRGLAFETNETESMVVVEPELTACNTFFPADDEEGRKSFVTDSEAVKGKEKHFVFSYNK